MNDFCLFVVFSLIFLTASRVQHVAATVEKQLQVDVCCCRRT